ncbi:hypothetical protein FQR65_LT11757 [Abscondita terminalis]|nr:hypothetical protein FQR65_LT11757 [Abscondita terminalis]
MNSNSKIDLSMNLNVQCFTEYEWSRKLLDLYTPESYVPVKLPLKLGNTESEQYNFHFESYMTKPEICDKIGGDYKNRSKKAKAWRSICAQLKEKFQNLSGEERKEFVTVPTIEGCGFSQTLVFKQCPCEETAKVPPGRAIIRTDKYPDRVKEALLGGLTDIKTR